MASRSPGPEVIIALRQYARCRGCPAVDVVELEELWADDGVDVCPECGSDIYYVRIACYTNPEMDAGPVSQADLTLVVGGG